MSTRYDSLSDKELLDLATADKRTYLDRGIKRQPASALAVRARINKKFKRGLDRMTVARDFGYTSEPGLRYTLGTLDISIEQRPVCTNKNRTA